MLPELCRHGKVGQRQELPKIVLRPGCRQEARTQQALQMQLLLH